MTAEAQRNRERAELEERVSVRRALLEQKVFILDLRFLSLKNFIINLFFLPDGRRNARVFTRAIRSHSTFA